MICIVYVPQIVDELEKNFDKSWFLQSLLPKE